MRIFQFPSPKMKQIFDRFGMICLSGVVFGLAHVITAIIQHDPWIVRKYLELGLFGIPISSWWWPILVALTMTLWATYSWLHSLNAIATRVNEKLTASWGFKAVCLLWVFSLLPQRVMDDNSGYIFLASDNPVWWLILEMDIARALFAFDILLRLLALDIEACNVTEDGRETQRQFALSMRSLAILSFLGLFIPILIRESALGGVPHVQDEIIQDWHARLLEAGLLRSPPMTVRASFQVPGMGDNGSSLFSGYQPAFACLLFLARQIGIGKLLNPILGVTSFWLLYLILRRSHSEETARIALCIGLISPFALLMQSSLMNHVLMLFLFVIGASSLDLADRGYIRLAAIIGGIALGLGWMTRRVDAIAMHIAWIAAWLTYSSCHKKKALLLIIALAISAGIFLVNMQLNYIIAGDSLYTLRYGQKVISDLAHVDLLLHLANFTDNLLGLGVFAFGGIVAALAGIGLLSPMKQNSAGLIERYLLINALFIVLGYSIYEYQDFCFGPRYFFTILPLAVVGIAVLLSRLRNEGISKAAYRLLAAGVAASILLTATQAFAVLANEFWHINPEFSKFVDKFHGKPHILFIISPTRQRVDLARYLQITWHFSGEEIMELLSADFIDTVGLRAFLENVKPQTKDECINYIKQYQKANDFRRPELYGINIYEVIRLNTINPLSQEVVLAIDRGDEANEALIRALPNHKPLLVYRTPAGYGVEPYRATGIANFDDILVP